jgi:hypothetical protein
MKSQKYTYNEVINKFKKEGWTLLSKIYKNNKQKLLVKCKKGHTIYIRLDQFVTGVRCAICNHVKKLTLDEVKATFLKANYIITSTKYINSWGKLDFICDKGHSHKMSVSEFKTGNRCGKCFGTPKHTLKEVKDIFLTKGWAVLSKIYKGNKKKLNVQCDKGHKITIALDTFLQGCGCNKCYYLSKFGESNPSWNHNLTPEERLFKRQKVENREWILSVFKRDKFTCQCCGDNKGHNLNAHHLEGFHWCIDLRYDLNNGVTLCENCHNSFHRRFWTRWNTSEQFYQFLRS